MSKPLIITIPHKLGLEEATRRIRRGFGTARGSYSGLLTIHDETWTGDRLAFNVTSFGQNAAGFVDVFEDHVRLEVTLPWLLAKFAEKFVPVIRKETVLLLEKK